MHALEEFPMPFSCIVSGWHVERLIEAATEIATTDI